MNDPVCEAKGYMHSLGYGGFFDEAEKREQQGEKQSYSGHCKLARWPEEQRTCRFFKRSEELESFYAKEAEDSEVRAPVTPSPSPPHDTPRASRAAGSRR